MDDVVKAPALLRPVQTISSIRCLVNGEVILKNYTNNTSVTEGDLLLSLDSETDTIELNNSVLTMEQLRSDLGAVQILLQSIGAGKNMASTKDDSSWIRSQAYISDMERIRDQVRQARILYEREKTTPENMTTSQKIADLYTEYRQKVLEEETWQSGKRLEASDTVKRLSQNIQTLQRRIAELERSIKNATIYASVSGKIDEVKKLNVGDFVLASEELFRIVPDGEKLKAELAIDAARIGRIKTGQKVHLRYPGLPPSKFGQTEALIALIPADMKLVNGISPVFNVEAQLDKTYLTSATGETITLRAGISAEGRIIVERDTVLKMILRKLDFLH